jgi:membrane-associated HD superfamily phosphohydrolase
MIVDIVEAKIRSIKATTPDADIASLIKGVMGQLTEETNLDELTIKQGRIITETLMTEYNVADHKRVSYESK